MDFSGTYRHSKLARHILLLFFICALLPLLCMSFFSYFQITQNLTEQSFAMLRQNTKSVSVSIYERLLLLETEMRFLAGQLIGGEPGQVIKGIKKSYQPTTKHFKALSLINHAGIHHQLSGIIDNFPPLESDPTSPFDYAKAGILIQDSSPGQPSVFMVIGLEHTEFADDFLIAEINPDYLWGIGEASSLPPLTEISIFDSSGKLLITTIPQPQGLLAIIDQLKNDSAWSQFKWSHGGKQYLACSRGLFLQSRFQVPGWIVVLSQPKGDALSSLMEFKMIFPLVLLLSILIVLLLSTNYIRKSLTPLEKLKKGTQLIADGDFTSRVAINSGDEFEELAAAFNKMSERLNHQFKELSMLAKIGRTMANIMSKDKLIQAASNAMENYLDFDHGMILMADGRHNRLYYAGGFGYSEEDIRQFQNYEIEAFNNPSDDPISAAFIKQEPVIATVLAGTATETPEPLNLFLKSTGSQSRICVPIVYESESLGVLVLERANLQESNWDSDEKLLSGVASQLAVSIANITSYNKLMESEARFRQSFDYVASGMALLDLNGYFMDVNEFFLSMLGFSEHELFGHTIFKVCHPEDADLVSVSLQKLRKGEIEFDSYEQRFLHSDGHTCWSQVSTSLLNDSEGNPLHFISLFQDLTDKRMTEKENEKLGVCLQQAQKMEAIGTLAGGIAHDFNNILSGIMGYAQLGMMEADPDSATYRWLQGVQEAGDRASELVKQILTFSRQGQQERTPIQIQLIIKEALKLLRATLPLNIDIQEKISNESAVVMADATQIHQLVMNLCTNAYHSMLGQGGTLEVILETQELSPGARAEHFDLQPGPYLKLTISDTGCGMDDATLNKIFDPYFTTKAPDKGTGLGLSVVHGIVESHGGVISVDSQPGRGTRFEVLFPQITTDKKAKQERIESIPTGSERVLLVDDEDAVVETGKSILEKLGYRVKGHTDPQKAYDEFAAHGDDFDLVITDMSMPCLTGEELSKRLMEIRPDIPILLCTGYSDQLDAANAYALGIKRFLIKPLVMGKLAAIIREVLDESPRSLPN
jgi:PAS domain S-box-containing protein